MRLKPKAGYRRILLGLLTVTALLAAFWLGVNVGNGRLYVAAWHHSSNRDLPGQLDYTEVNQVYQSLKQKYDGRLSEQQLEDGLKHGLAEATHDPYTVYFTAKEAKDFESELNNSFSGIGAQLGQDKDGNLEVIAPIAGLPADRAGLKAKDLIASINGETTAGMSIDEAVSKIRGPRGTKVKLQIVRARSQALNFEITREDINLPSVKTKLLDGNIGYLQISSFSKDTAGLTQKAAQDFKSKNVRGIVLDLRDNPGGLLDAAVDVSSLWLSPGTKILDQKEGGVVTESGYAQGGDVLRGLPTVVLINSGSASASEITAGALRDNRAAYLVGEKSYGKGVVQELINFGDGSELKVTVASWYRPNGQNINHRGITPDKTVKLNEAELKDLPADASEDVKQAHDAQLQAALSYLKSR